MRERISLALTVLNLLAAGLNAGLNLATNQWLFSALWLGVGLAAWGVPLVLYPPTERRDRS